MIQRTVAHELDNHNDNTTKDLTFFRGGGGTVKDLLKITHDSTHDSFVYFFRHPLDWRPSRRPELGCWALS